METDPDDQKHKSFDGNQRSDARRSWYTPAAQAYNRARPDYPGELIDQAIKDAELRADAHILEVGCGPGTATLSLARRGFAITGIEPNLDLCLLAQENLRAFPRVAIRNLLFEKWPLEAGRFDAVFAATSFHWVPLKRATRKPPARSRNRAA